jgi:dTDP-4-amino-4,6-dideoxygalactose transaminase
VGADYLGAPVGDCRFSDIAIFSFHPVKIITTAEGGVAVTNSAELAARMDLLRSHGVTRNPELMSRKSDGGWYYEQLELGFNYRMTDLHAALGRSQIDRLDEFVARRRALAARYEGLLAGSVVTRPWQEPTTSSSWHLYIIRIDPTRTNVSRGEVFEGLRAAGIGANVHYIPVYRQPYYQRLGFANADCPEAERYYAEALSIPLFPDMTDDEQDFIVEQLDRLVGP